MVLKLPDGTRETYSATQPTLYACNLVIGKLYIDINGKGLVLNHTTGEQCELDYKERGWSAKNASSVIAQIKHPQTQQPLIRITGKFTQAMMMVDLRVPEHLQKEVEIWRAVPKPQNYEWMYYFSRHTMQLNVLSDALREKLAPTDTRLRPDQRALELGDTETAIKEKHRLEEAQRARRREHAERGTEHIPAYFEMRLMEATGEEIWQSNGRYWEDRDRRDWTRLTLIY